MDALGAGGVPQLQLRPEFAAITPATVAIPGVLDGGTYPNRWMPNASMVGSGGSIVGSGFSRTDVSEAIRLNPDPTTERGRTSDIRPMIPLGQFRDTFIIAIDDEGVAIIDQHVAHERVLFERVMQQLTAGALESQRLLVPLLIDLSPASHQALLLRTGELARLGYELDSFGESTIKVSAVPALLSANDNATALVALAEDLEGLDQGAHVQEALQRIAATTACHAAVKANYPLTYEKMMHILEELRATAYSTICPHGRPVMLRLTRREIEKNFERI
jgi:DNA mismatch repair protein MutL